MKTRFAGLKQAATPAPPVAALIAAESASSLPIGARPARNAREGKKAVVGYFSPEVSRGLHQLALDRDTSLQALIGEAIDDLTRKHGKHPFGER
jgi:hypothetical protein